MLALAGYPLGLRFRFFDPDPYAPSRYLAEHTACDYSNGEALEKFACSVDFVTYEFENVPLSAAKLLQRYTSLYPPLQALEVSQDRFVEKTFLREVGIPTAAFALIDSVADAATACELVGLPAVLKTRRMGYDGKGQRLVRTLDELMEASADLGPSELVLEAFVPFAAECSLISARSVSGETRFYPLIENVHKDGILRTSRTPSPRVTPHMQIMAQQHADALMTALEYVGVLTIEYFIVGGALIANEIAPRVHNSGHWTIEGAETSQFENHLRAILDLPLGSTEVIGYIGMINIIGSEPNVSEVLQAAGAHLHLYDKSPRPNRKIGHVTVRAKSAADLDAALEGLSFVR
jgi:5-(carboxyamino)imidazole ribonucleotide synthase